jgi:cobalt-zinc-cadmium resistance protein CzcA
MRRVVARANVRGRDLGSFVAEARGRIARDVQLLVGDSIESGGQFEPLIRAERRPDLIVPLAPALILGLLCLTFHLMRVARASTSKFPWKPDFGCRLIPPHRRLAQRHVEQDGVSNEHRPLSP